MNLRSVLHALPVVVSLVFLPASHAAILSFETELAGSNEVPPVASAGSGSGTVQVDTVLRTLRLDVSFIGLVGLTTASHIHCCAPPGANAGVATQVPTFVNFPLGVTSGSYTQLFDMTQASSWNPMFIAAQGGTPISAFDVLVANMVAGQTYLNIHTNVFPGGEIRGQLRKVAEPATLALLAVALVGLPPLLRRRRS